jgi:hypothetical protein
LAPELADYERHHHEGGQQTHLGSQSQESGGRAQCGLAKSRAEDVAS